MPIEKAENADTIPLNSQENLRADHDDQPQRNCTPFVLSQNARGVARQFHPRVMCRITTTHQRPPVGAGSLAIDFFEGCSGGIVYILIIVVRQIGK